MKPHIWLIKLIIVTFIFVGIPVGGVMAYNYYIDPFWTADHSNEDNKYQLGFNERLQKTNWLNAHAPLHYDSLLIGTSRTTYINSSNFEESVFHYGLSSLHITEYFDYMKYAEEQNGEPFETIYMELTSRSIDTQFRSTLGEPSSYIEQTQKEFYRITHLFSYDTLQRAMENQEISNNEFSQKPRLYDRNMEVTTFFESKDIDRRIELFQYNQDKREKRNGYENFYNEDYLEQLLAIKKQFPHANFVVFNDLFLMERLDILLSNEKLAAAYKRQVEEIVEVFGTLYSFHIENEYTTDHSKYFDLFHYYPEVGDRVAQSLQNPDHDELLYPITKDTMDDYFKLLGL